MKFLSESDDIASVDIGKKNKFLWAWLNRTDCRNEKIRIWCKKIDVPGTCFCIACNTSIIYGSDGVKALLQHAKAAMHHKARDSVKKTQVLDGFYPGDVESLKDDERTVDLASRKSRAEAVLTAFIAEHSLSFSTAPDLIELCKTLAYDMQSLNSLKMSRTTLAYKLKHGLAKTIKDEQFEILRRSFFSLNIDESTSRNSESILSILVQYFCENQNKIVLRHLSSIKLESSNAASIYQKIVDIIEENNIPWGNLVSVLMDSCNTMRGKKNGVEKKLRGDKAPHLLDIDGDTCHTVNNCALQFAKPFDINMAEEGSGDGTDAKGIFGKFMPKPLETIYLSESADSYEYSMNCKNKGKCYIFNHKVFASHTNLNVRNGTDADASRLYCRFRELGFETKVFPDLTVREVNDKLKEVAKEDHSDNSCFVCCILSHGEHGILYGKDGKYPTENVFAPFRGDVCPTLVGKPKLFFIQACQGDKLDPGVNVVCNESTDSSSQFKIPTHADFLIVYSTVSGFYSWRNTTYGSWFIQALCAVLQEHAKDKDILQIMTIVNRKVAFGFESCVPSDPIMHLKKQVPLITSTLTRDLRFK